MISKKDFIEQFNKITFINEIDTNLLFNIEKLDPLASNNKSWEITNFEDKKEFDLLKNIAGMSTLANAKLINLICKSLTEDQLYVNIGTYQGFSLIAGLINTKCKVEGIDNFSQFGGPKDKFFFNFNMFKRNNAIFFDQNYVTYLENKKDPINFYFYDGPHKYSDQYNAIKLAAHLFKKGTIIMIDDTNVNEVKTATFKALEDLKLNYDIWVNINTVQNKHPTFWNGILILELI